MDTVVEFLESSTIHGLSYIVNIKQNILKLFWLCVVITSFSIAGILIVNSVSNWNESPIDTTIETYPIQDLKEIFPNVTVCPPEGTTTSLNYDLMNAENVEIDDSTRDFLKDLVPYLILEAPYLNLLSKASPFFDEGQIENWYLGKTKISLPYTSIDIQHDDGSKLTRDVLIKDIIYDYNKEFEVYEMHTSKLVGNLSTPYFGKTFSNEFFPRSVVYNYTIHVSDEIFVKSNGKWKLVVEIVADHKHYLKGFGFEKIQYKGFSQSYYKYWDEYYDKSDKVISNLILSQAPMNYSNII